LDKQGRDLKTEDQNVVSKEYVDVCLDFIPKIKDLFKENVELIAANYGITDVGDLNMLITKQVDVSTY